MIALPDYWIKGTITGEGDCTPASLLNALRHFGKDASLDEVKVACKWQHGIGAVPQDAYDWLTDQKMWVDLVSKRLEWPHPFWKGSERISLHNAAFMLDVYRTRFAQGFIAVTREKWNGDYHTSLCVGYEDGRLRRVCHITGVEDLRPEEWYWMNQDRFLLPAPAMWMKPFG